MGHPTRDDAKHLDERQTALVERSRHPGVKNVDSEELASIERDLRAEREAARRGHGSDGGGDGRSAGRRSQILTHAVKRVARERGRRERHLDRNDLRQFAADVMGQEMDKGGPKRGTTKGFAEAARDVEPGETDKGRNSPIGAN
ncbi:hypothetical protein [Lutibaculum baratangense]|nr:hypothetical protein [Lutibaculum baratangense]